MSDHDWDKELAKIDKQLASIPDTTDDEPAGATDAPAKGRATGMPRGVAATASRTAAPTPSVGSGRARLWSLVKLGVAVTGAVAITVWPWPARCGIALVGLVGACGLVVLLGAWSAFGTWRTRQGWPHLLALLVIGWGVVLGAREVLPRVGYAIPSFDRPDRWECQVVPPGSTDPEPAPPGAGDPGAGTADPTAPAAPRRTL